MNKHNAGKHYQQINAQTGVVDADPHRLIQMLFNGAIENILLARGSIERGDIKGKSEAISKAVKIVGGLADSVNPEVEAPVTENLNSLYEYVINTLAQANAKNDAALLDQTLNVLRELQAGWNAIREEALAASRPVPA